MAHLPLELYRSIFEEISYFENNQKTLSPLTRVCRTFQLEAERFLYRRLSPGPKMKDSIKICKLLCVVPRRVAYVHSFDAEFSTRVMKTSLFHSSSKVSANFSRVRSVL
jgi:hypothetical protein